MTILVEGGKPEPIHQPVLVGVCPVTTAVDKILDGLVGEPVIKILCVVSCESDFLVELGVCKGLQVLTIIHLHLILFKWGVIIGYEPQPGYVPAGLVYGDPHCTEIILECLEDVLEIPVDVVVDECKDSFTPGRQTHIEHIGELKHLLLQGGDGHTLWDYVYVYADDGIDLCHLVRLPFTIKHT